MDPVKALDVVAKGETLAAKDEAVAVVEDTTRADLPLLRHDLGVQFHHLQADLRLRSATVKPFTGAPTVVAGPPAMAPPAISMRRLASPRSMATSVPLS